MAPNRRQFCSQGAALAFSSRLIGQSPAPTTGSTARPNVATIDRDRIFDLAGKALVQPVTPIASIDADRSPGPANDYYSEPSIQTGAFLAHRDALFQLGHVVPTLGAAFLLTKEQKYADQAVLHLKAWFVTPDTAMTPALEFAQVATATKTGQPEGVIEGLPLAEIAQTIPFLTRSESMSQEILDKVTTWFTNYLEWLNTSRVAGLARDMHDHNGSSWLLQAAACARLNTKDDRPVSALRHQFRSTTIRAQINFDGNFPRELATQNPYRNSLFNLDMLAGVCDLLSTRFENVWDYELQDGPSMRNAVARYFPFIANRNAWPYKADSAFFSQLPLRRPALLLAARAYNRPEYADTWKTLPPDTSTPELDRTFPIRQPLLWVSRQRL